MHACSLHKAVLRFGQFETVVGVQGPWMKRQALHAASLKLQHPVTGKAFQLIGQFCFASSSFAAC